MKEGGKEAKGRIPKIKRKKMREKRRKKRERRSVFDKSNERMEEGRDMGNVLSGEVKREKEGGGREGPRKRKLIWRKN